MDDVGGAGHQPQRRIHDHAAVDVRLGADVGRREDPGNGARGEDRQRTRRIGHLLVREDRQPTGRPVGRRHPQLYPRGADVGEAERLLDRLPEGVQRDKGGEVDQPRQTLQQRSPRLGGDADDPVQAVPGQRGAVAEEFGDGLERIRHEVQGIEVGERVAAQAVDAVLVGAEAGFGEPVAPYLREVAGRRHAERGEMRHQERRVERADRGAGTNVGNEGALGGDGHPAAQQGLDDPHLVGAAGAAARQDEAGPQAGAVQCRFASGRRQSASSRRLSSPSRAG